MKRRSGAGGEPVKTRRHKTATLKRRNAPKAVRSPTTRQSTKKTPNDYLGVFSSVLGRPSLFARNDDNTHR